MWNTKCVHFGTVNAVKEIRAMSKTSTTQHMELPFHTIRPLQHAARSAIINNFLHVNFITPYMIPYICSCLKYSSFFCKTKRVHLIFNSNTDDWIILENYGACTLGFLLPGAAESPSSDLERVAGMATSESCQLVILTSGSSGLGRAIWQSCGLRVHFFVQLRLWLGKCIYSEFQIDLFYTTI
jgi:hypothetical protein